MFVDLFSFRLFSIFLGIFALKKITEKVRLRSNNTEHEIFYISSPLQKLVCVIHDKKNSYSFWYMFIS